MFKRKQQLVSFLSEDWTQIDGVAKNLDIKIIPRKDEFLFIEESQKYFKVLNVVHNLIKTNKTHVFIIIKEIEYQGNA